MDTIEINEYDILLDIFRFIRDYPVSAYTLPDVCKGLIKHLEGGGYQAEIVDSKHRDYKIIRVETQLYRIVRNKGWSTYDVVMTAGKENSNDTSTEKN